jgi:3',5'-cyclic AMP phosphodiesterase CpdA
MPKDAVRFAVGGDSRKGLPGEASGERVLRWAFDTATRSGASAFLYLGDMELTPPADSYFPRDLRSLDSRVAFCPVFGNHEALLFGVLDAVSEDLGPLRFARDHLGRCVKKADLPVVQERAGEDRVFYAVDLPGDVHFVALDNVSPELGFGEVQLLWLEKDLASARARGSHVFVGMHKALAGTGVTHHSMDEDRDRDDAARVRRESDQALDLFARFGVELVLASHEHGYWEFASFARGHAIRSFITGGLGAPLKRCAGPEHAFFHVLLVDVTKSGIEVTTVRYGD